MKVCFPLLISLFLCLFTHAQESKEQEKEVSPLAYTVDLLSRGRYDSALITVNTVMARAQESKDSLLLAKCLNNIGIIYRRKGDPVKSFFYYEQALSILQSIDDKKQVPVAMLNLGIAYKEQAIYDKALRLLLEAEKDFRNRDEAVNLSAAYNALGNVYKYQKRYDKALEYHANALKLRQDSGYIKGIAGSLNNIGSVYKDQGNYDSALIYFNQSMQLKDTSFNPEERANTVSNIAEIHYLRKDYRLAEKFYNLAHDILQKANNKAGLTWSFRDLAQLNFAKGNYSLAARQAQHAIELAEETGNKETELKCYDLLKKIHTSRKDYASALHYAQRYMDLNDTVLGEKTQKLVLQLEVKYETEKKQQELAHLSREKDRTETELKLKELQLESKSTFNRYLIITLVLLSAVIFLLLLLFRDRNRFAKKLDTVMRELHHRVKNNFQVLQSLFNLQLSTVQDATTKELINSNRNRIMAMMLIHSGLYFDEDVTRVKIGNYIQELVQNLLIIYELNPDRIRIEYDIDNTLDIDVDKSIPLGLLINELVTNALKYALGKTNPNPLLKIHFRKSQGKFHLIVKDNGPGMDATPEKRSFGLKLMENQVKFLKGAVQTRNDDGFYYAITFE